MPGEFTSFVFSAIGFAAYHFPSIAKYGFHHVETGERPERALRNVIALSPSRVTLAVLPSV